MNIDTLEAGRELDALVAEMVMGWRHIGFDKIGNAWTGVPPDENDQREVVRYYSENIAAAWQVAEMFHPKDGVETRCPKAVFYVTGMHDGTYRVDFTLRAGDNQNFGAYADTAPLAICRAALKVVIK